MSLVVMRDDYFVEAMRILAVDGFQGLKATRLCSALGVTRGSFYHHFGSWEGFVDALLQYWENEQTVRLVGLAQTAEEPLQRSDILKHLALTLPHEAEAAIRAWSRNNEAVAAAQRRVDDRRHEAIRTAILSVLHDARIAGEWATMSMAILIGFQQLRSPVDVEELRGMLDKVQQAAMLEAGMASGTQ